LFYAGFTAQETKLHT